MFLGVIRFFLFCQIVRKKAVNYIVLPYKEHKITYEIEGQQRRELTQTISETSNIVPRYKSVLTCAYGMGDLILAYTWIVFFTPHKLILLQNK